MLSQKLKYFRSKMSYFGGTLSKQVQLKHISCWTIFVIFQQKKSNNNDSQFSAIWITFVTFLEPFERTKLLKLGIRLKK